jgi:hypothetical protein
MCNNYGEVPTRKLHLKTYFEFNYKKLFQNIFLKKPTGTAKLLSPLGLTGT